MGEVAEAEGGAAEVFEAAVDRLGGAVAGVRVVELGQDVGGPLLEGPPETDELAEDLGDPGAQAVDDGPHRPLAAGRYVSEERTFEVGTHRLTDQVVSRVGPGWSGSAAPVRDAEYTYTPAGDLAKVTDAAAGYGRSECFSYDWAGRVTDAWAQSSTTCPTAVPLMTANLGGAGWYQAAYTYDGLGNRTSAVQRDARGTRSRSWSYPTPGLGVVRPHAPTSVSDQVGSATPVTATPTYTAAGDQTSRLRLSAPGPNGGDIVAAANQTLSYDVEGRVASVTTGTGGSAVTTSYLYDADGALLVTDSPSERTVHLSGDREVSRDKTTNLRSTTEVTTVGSVTIVETGTEQVSTTVTPGPGESTARLAEPVTTRAVTITDPHNTGVLQLDAQTLEVTGRRYSDPFGAPVGTNGLTVGEWVGDRGYANGHTDTGSGLVQLGARVYDPASGAFTEPDPVLDPSNPAQMHGVYVYAWNNPLTFTDPTGTEPRAIHNPNNKNPKGSDFEAPGYRWGGQPSHATSTARNNGHRASGARHRAQSEAHSVNTRRTTEVRRDAAQARRAPVPKPAPRNLGPAPIEAPCQGGLGGGLCAEEASQGAWGAAVAWATERRKDLSEFRSRLGDRDLVRSDLKR